MKSIDTHKTVAFGSSRILISDDNGLQNISELLEVPSHSLTLSLPGETAHENLGIGSVPKRGIQKLIPRTGT